MTPEQKIIYFDRDGRPLEMAGMVAAFESGTNRTVAFTRIVGDDPPWVIEVSTVHLVIDHQYGDGPPLIFETMVFGDGEGDCERYSTEQQAREGHTRMVAQVAAGLSRPVVLDIDPDELHASRLADPDGETP